MLFLFVIFIIAGSYALSFFYRWFCRRYPHFYWQMVLVILALSIAVIDFSGSCSSNIISLFFMPFLHVNLMVGLGIGLWERRKTSKIAYSLARWYVLVAVLGLPLLLAIDFFYLLVKIWVCA